MFKKPITTYSLRVKISVLLVVLASLQSAVEAQQTIPPNYDGSFMGDRNTPKKRQTRERYRLAWEGCKLVRAGKPEAGAVILHKVLSQDSTIGAAYIGLAEAYNALGDSQKSLFYYRKIMIPNPSVGWTSSLTNEYDHLVRFASVLLRAGKTSETQDVYNRVLNAAPDQLKQYLYDPGDARTIDSVKMTASIKLALSDLSSEAAHDEGKANADRHLKQSLIEARAATTIAPAYAPAYLMLGKMLVQQSKWDTIQMRADKAQSAKVQAVQAYKRAASLGKGETRAVAQEELQSYWLKSVKATP